MKESNAIAVYPAFDLTLGTARYAIELYDEPNNARYRACVLNDLLIAMRTAEFYAEEIKKGKFLNSSANHMPFSYAVVLDLTKNEYIYTASAD